MRAPDPRMPGLPELGARRSLQPHHAVLMDAWPLDAIREFRVELVEKDGRWYGSQIIFVRDDSDPSGWRVERGFWLQARHLGRAADAIEKMRRGAVARDLISARAPSFAATVDDDGAVP